MIYGSASIGRNAIWVSRWGTSPLCFGTAATPPFWVLPSWGGDLNASELPHTNVVNLNATLGCLRGLLREAKGGG